MKTLIAIVATLAAAANAGPHNYIFSDEWIQEINSNASTWTAGRNFHPETSTNYIKSLCGVHPMHKNFLPAKKPKTLLGSEDLPAAFDPR